MVRHIDFGAEMMFPGVVLGTGVVLPLCGYSSFEAGLVLMMIAQRRWVTGSG